MNKQIELSEYIYFDLIASHIFDFKLQNIHFLLILKTHSITCIESFKLQLYDDLVDGYIQDSSNSGIKDEKILKIVMDMTDDEINYIKNDELLKEIFLYAVFYGEDGFEYLEKYKKTGNKQFLEYITDPPEELTPEEIESIMI